MDTNMRPKRLDETECKCVEMPAWSVEYRYRGEGKEGYIRNNEFRAMVINPGIVLLQADSGCERGMALYLDDYPSDAAAFDSFAQKCGDALTAALRHARKLYIEWRAKEQARLDATHDAEPADDA